MRTEKQNARPEKTTGWDIRTQEDEREKWRGIISSSLLEKGWEDQQNQSA